MAENAADGILRPFDRWPPALQTAWDDYCDHRMELKKPLTRVATRRLAAKLDVWGHARALAALEWSMENGWIGVFEPPAQRAENEIQGRTSFKLGDWIGKQDGA